METIEIVSLVGVLHVLGMWIVGVIRMVAYDTEDYGIADYLWMIFWPVWILWLIMRLIMWPVRRLMRWRRERRALKASWAQTAQSVANAINLTGCGYNATTSGFTGAVTIRLGAPVDYAAVNAFNDAQIKRREQAEAEECEYAPKPVPYGSKPSEDARPVTRNDLQGIDTRLTIIEKWVRTEITDAFNAARKAPVAPKVRAWYWPGLYYLWDGSAMWSKHKDEGVWRGTDIGVEYFEKVYYYSLSPAEALALDAERRKAP